VAAVSERDWLEWHAPYDDPTSALSRRLEVVQRLLSDAFDRCPAGSIDLISMCAGQGRDVIGVLRDHPRRSDVRALLVERDERNVTIAREQAADLDADVHARCGDAGRSEAYAGFVPAQVVLACGVFGNISDADVAETIRALPMLCDAGATVLWTRHRGEPDLTPRIREWFAEAGFSEEAFVAPADSFFGVGAHRFEASPRPHQPTRLFDFVGFDGLASPG
jgi:hypothetical protein